MKEQRAAGVPMRVVSAKFPNHWIVRGIGCFATVEDVENCVLDIVGRIGGDEVEWTTYEYMLPHYLAYPEGDLDGLHGWPAGVFQHRYIGGGRYGPGERMVRDARTRQATT